jgi:hypothetical protein
MPDTSSEMVERVALTPDERDFLMRVLGNKRLKFADRVEDRLRQRLRRAGLVRIELAPRRWVVTPAGRAAVKDDANG